MTITKRKTVINLSEEEINSIIQTIAILRGLAVADLPDEDYEALTENVYSSPGDIAEILDALLTNLSNFTEMEEDTKKINW